MHFKNTFKNKTLDVAVFFLKLCCTLKRTLQEIKILLWHWGIHIILLWHVSEIICFCSFLYISEEESFLTL